MVDTGQRQKLYNVENYVCTRLYCTPDSPDEDLALLGAADLEAHIDLDPVQAPGHGGELRGGDEAGEQQLARHDVGLHHPGVHIVLTHHLQQDNIQSADAALRGVSRSHRGF